MKKTVLLFLVSMFLAVPSFSQLATRKDDIAITSIGSFLAGIPNATIRVCQNGATGTPCTPLAQIWKDSGEVNPQTNPFTADSQGNYFFYAVAGNYVIQVTSPTSGSTYTQNDVTLPNLATSVTTTFNFTSVPFSATTNFAFIPNTMFKEILTGAVTSSSITGGPSAGAFSSYSLCQDGVGGHPFTFPPNFVLPTGYNFLTAPNVCNNLLAIFDGTNWQVISASGGGSPGGSTLQYQFNNGGSFLGNTGLSLSSLTGPLIAGFDLESVGPSPWVDIRTKGARATNPNTTPAAPGITANCTNGQNTVTISSVSTFQNNDGVVVYGCGPTQSMSTPSAPTVTPSVALAGTRTGVVATGPTGSGTVCYKVVSRDKAGGLTAASSETCISTSQTLGLQTASVSAASRSNNITTFTTSSAHGFLPGCSSAACGEVFLSGFIDTSFDGWYDVNSVADSTHFTVLTYFDTRNGASTAPTTLGTATWWNCNHITGLPTNVWENYIYAGASGAETLYATSMPNGTNTDSTFDDFGSTISGGQTFPPFVPTNAPSSATSDHLSTTISSGAGTTTLTLANAAGTTVSGATIRLDAAPGILAAATAASNSGGSLYIPATSSGTLFVVNSFLDISSLTFPIIEAGPLDFNETMGLTGGAFNWYGNRIQSQIVAGAASWQPMANIAIGTAFPGVYVGGFSGAVHLEGLNFGCPSNGNSCVALFTESGFNFYLGEMQFNTGTTGGDVNGVGLYMRGTLGQTATNLIIDRVAFSGGPGGNVASHTGLWTCKGCGQAMVRSAYYLHRGTVIVQNSDHGGGGIWTIHHSYINGGGTPLYSVSGPYGFVIDQITLDTVGHPCYVNLGGFSQSAFSLTFREGACSPASNIFPVSGIPVPITGGLGLGVTPTSGSFSNTSGLQTGAINDGLFHPAGGGGNGVTYALNGFNGAVAVGQSYKVFVNGSAPTVTCSLAAGGSLTVGTAYSFIVTPIWQDNSEGQYSTPSVPCTPTTGNQTITINWTSTSGGPKGYNVYVQPGAGNGFFGPSNLGNPQAPNATSTTYSSNGSASIAIGSGFPGGGPTMLMSGTQGIVAPLVTITNNNGGSSVLSTNATVLGRSVVFPDAGFTVAGINLSQTFTSIQNFSTPISVPSGGTGVGTFTSNGVLFGNGTGNLLATAAGGAGTLCLVETNGGAPTFGSCSGSTSTSWSSLTNPSANLSLSMGANTSLFTYNAATGASVDLFNIIDTTGNTGTGHLFTVNTVGTSVAKPVRFTSGGTANGVEMNTSGVLVPIGTGGITANAFSGQVPIANGGTGQSTANTGFNALSPMTAAGDIIYGGTSGAGTRLAAGTANQLLHSGTTPSWSAVSLTADVSGILPIANGGTGQFTASAAFNALSPITNVGDLIIGTGTNAAGRLAIGSNGLCLVANGTTATWSSCAAGAVGGSGVSGQVAFWNGSSTITSNANFSYASNILQLTQQNNGGDTLYMKRNTDTTPSGNFLHFQNGAGNSDIFKLDISGNLTTAGTVTFNSSTAGTLQLTQGPAPLLVGNAIQLIAPTAVVVGGEQFVFPGTPSTGFLRFTNSSGVLTGSFLPASGIGACVNTVVTATNDNATPTCNPVTGLMFQSQAANTFLAAPNGSVGTPTFRTIVSADIPQVNLNLGGNGGVTGTLPISNGGTNATTALNAFNNLSPMTAAGDIIYGGTSGSGTRLAAGTATQVLHSGTTPSWSAVSLTTDVSGILPIANGGTNDTSANYSTNGVAYYDGTKILTTATGGAGTLCLTSVAGGAPSFGSCSGSSSTVWSNLTNPTGNLSLSMGANTTSFTWGAATGSSVNPFTIADTTNNTGTGDLVLINTASGSALSPFRVAAKGTANGVEMNTSGVLAAIGTGGITATSTTLSINTSSPLSGGGAFTGNLTLACSTCTTSGSALANNAVVVGSGGGQGEATIANGTSGQLLQSKGSGAVPAYITFPETKYSPSADCVNAVAGSGWSTGATPAALCRAGTNNKTALLSPWGASDVGYTQFHIPADADLTTNLPFLMLEETSTDTTNGDTIIMQESVSCAKLDGSTTDDVAFNAARSFGTITLNGNANRMWQANIQLNSTDLTGCSAPGTMWVKISRTTDTATNVGIYGVNLTMMRLIAVQAN